MELSRRVFIKSMLASFILFIIYGMKLFITSDRVKIVYANKVMQFTGKIKQINSKDLLKESIYAG